MNEISTEEDMLSIHDAAIENINESVHELLLGYEGNGFIYFFVEGRGDVAFYKRLMKPVMKRNWRVKIYPSGNRKKVIESKGAVKSHGFDLKKFGFIVDRDFCSVISDENLGDEFFITDGYSVENYLCQGSVILEILEAYYGCCDIKKVEADSISQHFDKYVRKFSEYLFDMTCQMALWRVSNIRADFSSIDIRKFVSLNQGMDIISGKIPDNFIDDLAEDLGISRSSSEEIDKIKDIISQKYKSETITRGKFLAWFFCRYLEAMPRIFSSILGRQYKLPSPSVSIGPKNFTSICGPYADMPENFLSYILGRFQFAVEVTTPEAEAA